MKLILGDSVDKLKELDDNSIDSVSLQTHLMGYPLWVKNGIMMFPLKKYLRNV